MVTGANPAGTLRSESEMESQIPPGGGSVPLYVGREVTGGLPDTETRGRERWLGQLSHVRAQRHTHFSVCMSVLAYGCMGVCACRCVCVCIRRGWVADGSPEGGWGLT